MILKLAAAKINIINFIIFYNMLISDASFYYDKFIIKINYLK